MKAVVMAGGEGTRLRPLTCTVPKPMIKIMGKPVIGYIFDLLAENGFDEIAVTVRYRAEDIESYVDSLRKGKIKIKCVEENRVLGTAGSVKNAAKDWNEPFLVISGDCICDFNLKKIMHQHKKNMSDVTIVCKQVENTEEYGTVLLNESDRIESFCEKPDWRHASSDRANTGIYVINPAVLDGVPDNVPYDFACDLFPAMMNSGKRLFGLCAEGYWCDIGDLKSLRMCVRDIMDNKVNTFLPKSKRGIIVKDDLPDGDYDIIPPVYIGKNVTFGKDSVIGPYTVIEDNTHIGENSRVKKSMLMSNASVCENCDTIGAIIGERSIIKANSVCLEGCCIGDGCIIGNGSTVSNNVLVWPEKRVPYRSVIIKNLREGKSEYELIGADGISGETFTEISCEKCCRLGEALAGSSFGGNIGIGYDTSKSSKALAMAIMSGLISGGSKISDFGECIESQMSFFVSFCALDSGIYICANPKTTHISLFGQYGLPMYRKYERELENRYKRSDFRFCNGVECNEIHDMSSVGDIYEGQLITSAGNNISGAAATIKSNNPMIKRVVDKCFYLLGCVKKDSPEFTVDYSGKTASARDEQGSTVPHDKLLVLCAVKTLMNGEDIAVPFDAPKCLDDFADKYDCAVYRIGESSMTDYSQSLSLCVRHCMWAFDALSLCFNVIGIIRNEKKYLYELINELPDYAIKSKIIAPDVSPAKLASILKITTGSDTQGLRKAVKNGYVTLSGVGAGRLIKILAEADDMETAEEICIDTENKINSDGLDIFP